MSIDNIFMSACDTHNWSSRHWAPLYPIRRLIIRFREVSNPWDLYLKLSDRSEIWQARRHHCCRGASQISKRCDDSNGQSRRFETSRDLTIRRLIGYWNGAQEALTGSYPFISCLHLIDGCLHIKNISGCVFIMMTSSNGIFRVTGPLCGEFTGHRWIPLTKASDAGLLCFLWFAPE